MAPEKFEHPPGHAEACSISLDEITGNVAQAQAVPLEVVVVVVVVLLLLLLFLNPKQQRRLSISQGKMVGKPLGWGPLHHQPQKTPGKVPPFSQGVLLTSQGPLHPKGYPRHFPCDNRFSGRLVRIPIPQKPLPHVRSRFFAPLEERGAVF